MPKREHKGSSILPIEGLFAAITDGDLQGVRSSINRGANMRIKIDGMYPVQRAMLAEAMIDERDPRKIDIRKILTLIEEKSKTQGLVYEGQNLVDKRVRATQEQLVKKSIKSKGRREPPVR